MWDSMWQKYSRHDLQHIRSATQCSTHLLTSLRHLIPCQGMPSDPSKIGMSENMLNVIVSFYLENLKAKNQTFFSVSSGTRQGCVLTPPVFCFLYFCFVRKKCFKNLRRLEISNSGQVDVFPINNFLMPNPKRKRSFLFLMTPLVTNTL